MNQWNKLSLLVISVAAISIITIVPVMADGDKITICHYVKEDRVYNEITIGKEASLAHDEHHENDLVPAPDDGCTTEEESEIETQNNYNEIISKTHTTEVLPGERLITSYFCAPGEIIMGGLIEMPTMENPLSNDGDLITSTEQSYNIVTGKNTTLEPIKVIVTYLCYASL